ncbi:MAG TPA: CPBP family glutamic-type intramembrane protease [Steroidobacteraceae bacterium]|jgi:membrane protease YdiL (CAAX protease family)
MNSKGAILWYLGITTCASGIFWTLIIKSGHLNAANGLYVAALMWSPGIGAIATVLIKRLGIGALGLRWGDWRYGLFSYVTPLVYATIAYALIWTFGFGSFPDPAGLAAMAHKAGGMATSPLGLFMLVGTIVLIPSLINALGEEIGWRGLLTPLMITRFGFTRGSLLVGIIWAAWHLPLLLFADYNSGTPWWFSLPCFCALTVGLSFVLTWFRLASASVWPCAILHASHNAFIQAFFTPLTGSRGTLTAYVIDEFGVAVPLIVVLAAIGFWLDRRRAMNRHPSHGESTGILLTQS